MPDWGGGAKGAVGGAAMGTAILPGWGTAIGAGIGGLVGLFGGGDDAPPPPSQNPYAAAQLASLAGTAQQRQAAQIGGVQFGVDPTGRQGVLGVANRLGGIAGGQQMGAGELAVNHQLGQGMAAQTAAARMAHGANAAIAARNAMRNQADMQFAGAGQAAQYRMQDQAAANQQLGSLYGNLYGQDATIAAQNAQLGQSTQIANQQAQMQQQGMNDAMQMQALGQMLGWSQDQINAYMAQTQRQQANQQAPNLGASLLQNGGQMLALGGLFRGQPTPPVPPPVPPQSGGGSTNTAGGQLLPPGN